MPDMTAIAGVLAGLKAATEAAQVLRNLDSTVKTADLKLRIAELVTGLSDAKLALVDLQGELREKDETIKKLTEALKVREEVVRVGDAYWKKDQDGKAVGSPYCSHCYETKNGLLIHTSQNQVNRSISVCPHCKATFPWQPRREA